MGDAIIEVEDDDFLSQVAAVEIAALSDKRHKTAATTSTNGTTRTTDLSQANTNKEEGAEGTYTAALIGSRSLLFQQQSSSASGQAKGLVAGSSNNNVNVFANPEFGGGGSTVGGGGVGGGSCFKCGKSGHWARHCDANSYAVVDPSVTEKACPCRLGSCIVLTANTEKNRGRQFYKCPLTEENGGCGYFEWCDKNIGTDNMTFRSQNYASNQSHASNPSIPELSCLCGAGPCLILTAKTEKNSGKMFYRCPANQINFE